MKVLDRNARPVAWFAPLLRHPMPRLLGALLMVGVGFVVAQLALNGLRSALGLTDRTQLTLLAFVLFVPGTYAAYRVATAVTERRAASELAAPGAWQELGGGALGGLGLFSAVVGSLWLLGVYRVSGFTSAALLPGALAGALTSAFVQELVFRGQIFRVAAQWLGARWAVVGSALLFGVAHLASPGASALSTCAVVAAGILFAAALLRSGRLWLAIGLHAGWDFANDGIFGVALAGQSGHAIPGLLRATLHGPAVLTGGAFGVEASLAAVLVIGAAGAALLWRTGRGRVVRGSL